MIEEKQAFKETAFDEISQEMQKTNDVFESVREDSSTKTETTAKKENGSPEAEPELPTKRVYDRSIPSTLSHAGDLISCINVLGGRYRCAYPQFAPAALQAKRVQGYEMIEAVGEALAIYKQHVVSRQLGFIGLATLVSRIISEMEISGASYKTIEQMRFYSRKLEGARKVKKDPDDPDANYNSVSQGTFAQLVENFALVVTMVANDPNYNPDIDDLKVVNLQAKVVELRAINNGSQSAKAALEDSRRVRNHFFNNDEDGLVKTFMTAKKVIFANFGSRSEEYRQVSGLSFTKIKGR